MTGPAIVVLGVMHTSVVDDCTVAGTTASPKRQVGEEVASGG